MFWPFKVGFRKSRKSRRLNKKQQKKLRVDVMSLWQKVRQRTKDFHPFSNQPPLHVHTRQPATPSSSEMATVKQTSGVGESQLRNLLMADKSTPPHVHPQRQPMERPGQQAATVRSSGHQLSGSGGWLARSSSCSSCGHFWVTWDEAGTPGTSGTLAHWDRLTQAATGQE